MLVEGWCTESLPINRTIFVFPSELTFSLILLSHSPRPAAAMEVDDFQIRTDAFLSWLAEAGVRMSPKMQVKDLRSESRGRGVGKSSFLTSHNLPVLLSLAFLIVRLNHSTSLPPLLQYAIPQADMFRSSGHRRFRRGRSCLQHPSLCSSEHYYGPTWYRPWWCPASYPFNA